MPGWDPALDTVVAALASAFADPRTIRTLIAQSRISRAEVDPDGTVYDRWFVVVERANAEGEATVDRLLRLALNRSPDHALHQAIRTYWQRHRDLQAQADEPR